MKFYQKRGFALVVLILAIIGSGVYGISKKPAALPEVSYYNWICDEAGLLDQETRQTIQDYNTAWNEQYYAVVAVAAVDDIRGWSSEDYAREWGPGGAWEPTICCCSWSKAATGMWPAATTWRT